MESIEGNSGLSPCLKEQLYFAPSKLGQNTPFIFWDMWLSSRIHAKTSVFSIDLNQGAFPLVNGADLRKREGTNPPVTIEVVSPHREAFSECMRDDIMPKVCVRSCVLSEVILILMQQVYQDVALEDVDAHGGLEG